MTALLNVEHMTHFFGGLRAVHDYNLEIPAGKVCGLIGPNGAGKTTIFNLITGIFRPTEGHITLEGQSLLGLAPHEVASRGLGRTFQNMLLWRHMTVLDHVKLARFSKLTYGLAGAFLGTRRRHREEAEHEAVARRFLTMTNLPYGAQRRVEMARALATEPKILFLDEPTAGMNPEELSQMMDIIRRMRDEIGVGIFLIEHRLRVVMELCERIQTLVFGEVIAEGTPHEIQNNPAVIDAYLGKEAVA
jgi:branched-chain amino acid transport system ATP-binding protein